MKLLVAEKPSVAREHYAKMLERLEGESFRARDGYLEGQNWCVSWCVGHLITLAPMDQYEGFAGSWKLGNLPCLPEKFHLEAISSTQKQLKILAGLMQKAELIINGADAGREGNLIFDLVIDYFPAFKKIPQKRLWVNSYVEKDLDQAYQKLEAIEDRLYLSYAARLRQRADWMVGLNATRLYTLTAGRGSQLFSVGRVQTPTLNLIVQRDAEVESFKEFFVYGLLGLWDGVSFQWSEEDKVAWSESKALVERLHKQVDTQNFTLKDWKKSNKKSFPPKPFDLTDLQKESHRKFKITASRTLEIAQELYEKKLISYPRTDCAYITESMKKDSYALAQKMAQDSQKQEMRPLADKFVFVNDKKVSDHYAILPTGLAPKGLTPEHQKIYDLIVERFITAWLNPWQWQEGVALIEWNQIEFRTILKIEKSRGWKSVLKEIPAEKDEKDFKAEEAEEEVSNWLKEFPKWKVGDLYPLLKPEIKEKKKSKPKPYTEATLLSAMKSAGRQIEDEELAEAMKERGLGTPATQASIIETLKSRQYIAEEKGYLRSTPLGRKLIQFVDDRLKSPELTGEWEFKLRQVEKGGLEAKEFSQGIKGLIENIFGELKERYHDFFQRENESFTVNCLCCQSPMQQLNWGIKCSAEDCTWKMPFVVAGRMLSVAEIQALMAGEVLENLDGFLSKRGFAFTAGLKLNEAKEVELILREDPDRVLQASAYNCPVCKKQLKENTQRLSCEACAFVFWKKIAGVQLNATEIQALFHKELTAPRHDFISKKGSTFSAQLRMNTDYKVEFVFENKTPLAKSSVQIHCPQCKHSLVQNQDLYWCVTENCHFQIPKIYAQRSLSEQEVHHLCQHKRSVMLTGFVGKTGQKFQGVLVLDAQGKLGFDKETCVLV